MAYIDEVLNSMKEMQTGKSIGEVRWFFENIALPYLFFHSSKEVIEKSESDKLYVFRLFDSMIKGMGLKNTYSLTPEMTYSGRPKEDRMQLVVMPEPKDIGHAYAIMMFTDENYDFPGYFMIVLGADDTLHLIAWDYLANVYNLGLIDDPEDAAQIAYESYIYSRENSKQS